jgi:hypothetical protein
MRTNSQMFPQEGERRSTSNISRSMMLKLALCTIKNSEEIRSLSSRMDGIENRMDRMENRMDRIEKKLSRVVRSLSRLNAHLMNTHLINTKRPNLKKSQKIMPNSIIVHVPQMNLPQLPERKKNPFQR